MRPCDICGRDLPTIRYVVRKDGMSRTTWLCPDDGEPLEKVFTALSRPYRITTPVTQWADLEPGSSHLTRGAQVDGAAPKPKRKRSPAK